MSTEAVAVTGMGMVTAAGHDTPTTWDRIRDGLPTASYDPRLEGLPVTFSCRAETFRPEQVLGRGYTWRTDRFIQLALAAAREAAAHAGLEKGTVDPTRLGVIIGANGGGSASGAALKKLNDNRPQGISPATVPSGSANMAAGEVSIDLGAQGPSFCVSTACASGASAMSLARDLLRSGTCDVVVAGGSDSICSPLATASLDKMRALSRRNHAPQEASRPFDADRDGFVLAEGAAVLVLERGEHARARRAAVHAYLAGSALGCDAHHPTAPTPDGSGSARTIRAALASAGMRAGDIDHVNTHGSSTELNDLSEARALRTVFGSPPPVTANKSVLGHAIAGAGAIEAALTVLTLQHQQIPPTANLDRLDDRIDLDVVTKAARPHRMSAALSTSFGFGGQNAALIFTSA
ncbi:beta-ketoacyl-[acyl-carrier-protein] synthase family protein [Streptomyces sp. NPDC012794]|uniref:beta-ketoacyl-[acyl-carrier-protein] synthase family protein n=1 Tax=Streptomyces sp. NPDC012794 TaxID=3364850 RepID=UPI0036874BD1